MPALTMKKYLFLLCLLPVLLVSYTATFAAAPKPKKHLVIATYTYGENDRIRNIQPIALDMARALNATLRLKSYATIGELVEALRQGEVDIAVMNTFGYLLLQTDPTPPIVPLAALEVPADALDAYTSSLIASKKSGIKSMAEVGRNPQTYTIVFAGRHSTSGNLIPRLYLSSLGILNPEEQFSSVGFMNSHTSALQEVIHGSTDIAALGTGEYERQLVSGNLKEGDVTLLWESEGIPQGPVVCKASMPAKQQKKLRQALLQAHQKNPEAIAQLKLAWTEASEAKQFVPVTEQYYNSIIKLAGNRNNLRKVLEQHLQ